MTSEEIRIRLAALAPTTLEIEDQSAAHAHHKHNPSANKGGTHFAIRIESARFTGLSALARHRLVHAAMGDAFASELHALAITATAPGEE